MSKCIICHTNEAVWAWQPFGPSEDIFSFTVPGSHYRGFPVIKICGECKDDIQAKSQHHEFEYKGWKYIIDIDCVLHVPDYVDDALLWLEEAGGQS